METNLPIPQKGDRIRIKNVPPDYHFRNLYLTEGRYEGVIDNTWTKPTRVGFYTGYVPYLDKGEFGCSGAGYAIDKNLLRFAECAPANFWRFKNGIPGAHRGVNYPLEVNYWECDFKDIT
jgi:hypothetical protein